MVLVGSHGVFFTAACHDWGQPPICLVPFLGVSAVWFLARTRLVWKTYFFLIMGDFTF
jgi:hypothetical protein